MAGGEETASGEGAIGTGVLEGKGVGERHVYMQLIHMLHESHVSGCVSTAGLGGGGDSSPLGDARGECQPMRRGEEGGEGRVSSS